MDIREILKRCDHTLLKQEATWEQVKEICDDAVRYSTASVCISPCYVKRAKKYLAGQMKICTVIGFPNGTQTMETKAFEAAEAVRNGADEIDMVINIGALKAGDDAYVADEIRMVRVACQGRILKVIIETCLLTEEEKIRMCRIVTECGADYKTNRTKLFEAYKQFCDSEGLTALPAYKFKEYLEANGYVFYMCKGYENIRGLTLKG